MSQYVLDASGRSGRHATNQGRNGTDQVKANDAPVSFQRGNGMNAESGRHGTHGENGSSGENGTSAMDSSILVYLDQNNQICVNSANKQLCGVFPLSQTKIKVALRGGSSGNASDGGRGGHGGLGGNGSNGNDANNIDRTPGNGGK
jgi:hypothetical protein